MISFKIPENKTKKQKRKQQWFVKLVDVVLPFIAWHEKFEKLILLRLAEKVSFHLNISSKMKKLQTCISSRINKRKLCLCYLLFYLVWWPRFLISKQHFCWFLQKYLEYSHQISSHKSEKYDLTFGTKITGGWKKFGGMMLWIMSGTFKLIQLDI